LARPELGRRGQFCGNDYAEGTAAPVFSTYILGPLLTLLPRPWRTRVFAAATIQAAGAAALSGILESVAALAVNPFPWPTHACESNQERNDHSLTGLQLASGSNSVKLLATFAVFLPKSFCRRI